MSPGSSTGVSAGASELNDITYTLPSTTSAPGMARTYLEQHFAHLPADLLGDAQLLVTELVTNAVLHGEPDITLRLRLRPPSIGVAVHDRGADHAPSTTTTPAPLDDTHGRGLVIVDALASDWGVNLDSTGKTIWFELRMDDAAE